MRRSWIGFGLLAVLLAGGLLVSWGMGRFHDPIAQDLDQAANCALAGNWDRADILVCGAKESWEKRWGFSAAFADHEPMEDIDGLFAQLEVYAKARECVPYAASCAELSRRIEAMSDAHELKWRNLL